MIPRIIHQIWLQGSDHLPEKYLTTTDRMKNFHPQWKYILWSEVDILKELTKEQVQAYYSFIYLHQKVDYARYVLLDKYGGVYIDVDVDVVKSIDTIMPMADEYDLTVSKLSVSSPESYFICKKSECLNNGIIIAKPNNIILKDLISHINQNSTCSCLSPKISCINNTTGPNVFNHVLSKHNNVLKLDSEYFEPCFQGTCNFTKNTILVHHQDGTWFGDVFRKCIRFYFANRIIIIIVILLLVLIFCMKMRP